MLFQRPQKNQHGWFVATMQSQVQYLHSDGELRESTCNNETGKYTGYFTEEVEAYRALYDHNWRGMYNYNEALTGK